MRKALSLKESTIDQIGEAGEWIACRWLNYMGIPWLRIEQGRDLLPTSIFSIGAKRPDLVVFYDNDACLLDVKAYTIMSGFCVAQYEIDKLIALEKLTNLTCGFLLVLREGSGKKLTLVAMSELTKSTTINQKGKSVLAMKTDLKNIHMFTFPKNNW